MPISERAKPSITLLKKGVLAFTIILVASCLIELIFFNFNAISSRLFDSSEPKTYVNEEMSSSWEITGIDEVVNSISIEPTESGPSSFTISVKDEGKSATYNSVGQFVIDEDGPSPSAIHLYGKTISMKIKGTAGSKAQSLTINPEIPFDISKKRILILTVVFLTVWVLRPKSQFHKIEYKSQPSVLIASILVSSLLSIGILYYVAIPWHNSFNEKYGVDFSSYEQNHEYHELAIALASGNLSLRNTPSEELMALDNPYDPSLRADKDVEYLWDHAYYQGSYYSYFGILPAITLYLPYYVITGNELSNTPAFLLVAIAYSIAIVAFLDALFRRWFRRSSLGIYTACFCTLLISTYLLERCCAAQIYQVAICYGGCCALFALAFWIRATDGPIIRIGLAAIGTLFASLTLLSRPQFALVLFVGLILLVDAIRQKKLPENRWRLFLVFVPLVVVGLFMGWYNAARFGSVFDFGANYNLTTNDMTKRPHSFDQIVFSFFSYLIQPIHLDVIEPYLLDAQLPSGYLGVIIYEPPKGGLFSLAPAIALGVVMAIVSERDNKRLGRVLAICLISCGVIIALFDGDAAGILGRYFSDFGVFFGVAACLGIGLLGQEGYFASSKQTGGTLADYSSQPSSKNLLLWILSIAVAISICMQMLSVLYK